MKIHLSIGYHRCVTIPLYVFLSSRFSQTSLVKHVTRNYDQSSYFLENIAKQIRDSNVHFHPCVRIGTIVED